MYIHAPDPFYMRGINKDGMGYVETNWNLPLWEQINLARQNIYDGTWTKVPSQGAVVATISVPALLTLGLPRHELID